MRTLLFLPLTFVCGVDGFAFFAPYLVVFLAMAYLLGRRTPRLQAVRLQTVRRQGVPIR